MSGRNDPNEFWKIEPPTYDAPPLQPGPMPALKGPDGLAIASLILGIIGLVALPASMCLCPGIGFPLSFAGLICGIMSKDRGGLRTAGIVTSAIGFAGSMALLLFVVALVFLSPH